jgi:pimeloyl-ACP methyl ester carboxylesterase
MQAKTIVFISGAFLSNSIWDEWRIYFENKGFVTIAPSWPHKDETTAALKRRHPDPAIAGIDIGQLVDYYVQILEQLPEKTILIGHSAGGLVTQLLLQKDLARAGVAIHSFAPAGTVSYKLSLIKATSIGQRRGIVSDVLVNNATGHNEPSDNDTSHKDAIDNDTIHKDAIDNDTICNDAIHNNRNGHANNQKNIKEIRQTNYYGPGTAYRLWNPFTYGSVSFLMSFSEWQSRITNGMPLSQQISGYELFLVPESRKILRAGITGYSRLDFNRAHGPLLFIAGSADDYIAAWVNYMNYQKYSDSGSVTNYKEFAGKCHFVLAQQGWQDVAAYILDWLKKV